MTESRARRDEEIFLPLPAPRGRVPEATHLRSTWLSSSLQSLRDRGLYAQYLALLPREHHEAVTGMVAGVWLPIELALAHYRACNELGLSRAGSWEIGIEVTRKVHGTSLSLAVRLARQAGVTPWSIFAQLHRLWDRVWTGGGIAVYKAGPKEAVIEVIRWRCAEIPYVRQAMPSVVHGVVEMFCRKAYVHDVPQLASTTSLGMRVQWA